MIGGDGIETVLNVFEQFIEIERRTVLVSEERPRVRRTARSCCLRVHHGFDTVANRFGFGEDLLVGDGLNDGRDKRTVGLQA